MKLAAFFLFLSVSVPVAEAGQARRAATQPPVQAPDKTADAYEQFLRARMLEDEDVDAAIAAYKRAMALDPAAADIQADLADLYLRENRPADAITVAEQAIKISAANRDAHRVLGTVYATLAVGQPNGRISRASQQENLSKAILHLEQAFEPGTPPDANLRAMLARVYMRAESYDKAIPILVDLVKEEPGWQEGPALLTEAYSAAGRGADAVAWLEEAAPENPQLYMTLGDFYVGERRWVDAASAYEQALHASPRSFDLRVRMAEALLNAGSRADIVRARDVLREAVAIRGTDERGLFRLSQAERASGDSQAAETVARRLISQNNKNPRGYSVLAEALEDQRRYQPIIDALAPAVASFRGIPDGSFAVAMLLPHLGFAYQELGQYDKAIGAFEDARKIAPNDPSFVGYLIQAQMAAKNYTAAAELAHAARAQNADDLRLARLESLALRRGGKVDAGLAILEELVRKNDDDSDAYIALAQGYIEANRNAQAVKLLQDAQAKFPAETGVSFELGAALDRQKRFVESEAIFRRLIEKEPDNAQALNYLGYMLAERGERLTESVDYLKRALVIDPDNGSYLDSIGWAYFKDGKFQLALENLKKAADQLTTNSVVQDHYGEILFKLGRFDDAIGAWNKALSGDGDSIVRADIDKKIKSAKQKLPKR